MKELIEEIRKGILNESYEDRAGRSVVSAKSVMQVIDRLAAGGGWKFCSSGMPPVEKEVYVLAKRKYANGKVKYICTTAYYEDGTVRENDSHWRWEDVDGEWDEKEDCLIIPEGWWEYRHYNADEVYNNVIDSEVIAWQPLPTLPWLQLLAAEQEEHE